MLGIRTPLVEEVADGEVQVHFIDVGQGDSELIVSEDFAILIDSGEREYAGTVYQYINTLGIKRLDYIICSHPHSDHIGGMYLIIEELDVGTVLLPEMTDDIIPTTSSYGNLLRSIEANGCELKTVKAGEDITLNDECRLEILAPVRNYDDLNNYSIVCRFLHGQNSFLFTGDIESEAENDIIKSGAELNSDVIKVPHHGSNTSSTYYFLKKVLPDYAVFEVGASNDYEHPHKEPYGRYGDMSCKRFRTDLNGTIVFISDGRTLKYVTENNNDFF